MYLYSELFSLDKSSVEGQKRLLKNKEHSRIWIWKYFILNDNLC